MGKIKRKKLIQKSEQHQRLSLIHLTCSMCGLGQRHWDSGAGCAELEVLAKHFKVQKLPGQVVSD